MRSLLVLSSIAALAAACAQPAHTPGTPAATARAYTPSAQSQRELLPEQQVQHVLNRLAFGPRPSDMEAVRSLGVDRWIERQLYPERISDRSAEAVLARYTALDAETSDLMAVYQVNQQAQRQTRPTAGDTANQAMVRQQVAAQTATMLAAQGLQNAAGLPARANTELLSAKVARATLSERQLYEVMVDFWENHFSVFQGKGQTRLFLVEYDRDVIRPHAMGRFRDLLGEVAHSSAMLFYLDNWQSQADSLHPTLAQVRGARGNVNAMGGAAAGRGRGRVPPPITNLPPQLANLPPEVMRQLNALGPEERQAMIQQLLQRVMNQGGQRQRRGLNENYARELMELHTLGVDGGYTQKDVIEVARALTGWTLAMQQGGGFIFRPEFHDAAEKTVLGHTFAAGRGIEDGEQVLDILARHPSTARYITTKLARRFIADDPPATVVDRCAGVFRATDGDIRQTLGCVVTSEEFFSTAAYRSKVKTPFEVVVSALRATNASPDATARPAQAVAQLGQPIFGRQTPDGWPDRADAWMNTGAILNRINFGLSLAGGRVPGVTLGRVPALDSLRTAPRERQVDGVIRLLFGGEASPETREILLTGQNPFAGAAPADTMDFVMDTGAAAGRGGRAGRPGAPPRPVDLRGRGGRAGGPGGMVDLDGLAQVVGLALGAPEFQRR
jgi:uncharacterized protein (DUF1800 family)